jgi:two-component system cell cycle sensor histidine kinase/response regulator CckA
VEVQAVLKGSLNRRVRIVVFPAANDANLIVTAIETGAAPVIDEQTAQGQKLQAVGELAGGIAHDFNNLLTAIIGFSDLLLRRFRASDPAFKDLMNIKNNATRAAELVKQILAYSRKQTLRPAILRVTDVIEEFQATMGRTLGEKVKAKVQHGRDLWFVKADEGQFFQVIMNLAVNARDAMPNGGEILITTENVGERESLALKDRGLDRGEYVMCEVRDTGTGIKPEHLEKIFDPFFSTKEVGKGTGLGLSTVYGIVKQTGGTILVDSEIGQGTSFRIYLPRYVETEQDLKALENKAEAPDKVVDLTGQGTVLLVEDEDAVRSFASRALATRGYKVLEAASGVEALEVMDRENGNVDLVVSDVVMPEMDGPTLLRHLRQRNPNIRIIFMSGYAEEAFRKNLGADENFVFLPKPFTLKKLAETVKAAAA